MLNQEWLHRPMIPELGRPKKNSEFKANENRVLK